MKTKTIHVRPTNLEERIYSLDRYIAWLEGQDSPAGTMGPTEVQAITNLLHRNESYT